MAFAGKKTYVAKKLNSRHTIELTDVEIVDLYELYEKKELTYDKTPALLIDPDTIKSFVSEGGMMKYMDFVILNIQEYKKNKNISYVRFKLCNSAGRGFCLLNSNAKFPGKKNDNKDNKDDKDDKKVDLKGKGVLSFTYTYPSNIEQYYKMSPEQVEKKLQEKFASENKDGDIVARGKYVNEQHEIIKYCMNSYIRDKFFAYAFEHSFRSEFNKYSEKLSYAKLFDDETSWEANKDSLTIKNHSQTYTKISPEDSVRTKAFMDEKKKYEALVKSGGDVKTCDFGIGKKYFQDTDKEKTKYQKIDNPIYWVKRKMDYVMVDNDYKITNGKPSHYGSGVWDQFKLTYIDENGDSQSDKAPTLFSEIKYAMTAGSLCNLTFTYQCVWNVKRNTLAMDPKVPSVIVIKREPPKSRDEETKTDNASLELMKKFSKINTKKPDIQAATVNKEEKKDEPHKPKVKTDEQKNAEQKAMIAAQLANTGDDDDD